ncbi:MAG: MFS transporter [Nitrospinota bacterium]
MKSKPGWTPNPRERLRGAAILFTTNVIVTIGGVMIAPLLPVFAQRAGAAGAWMGALFAVDMVARTAAMPLCGRASDRLGRRPFLLMGLLIFVAASFAFTLTSGKMTLLLVRTLQGLGAGMVIPVIMAYFGEFAAPSREAFAMGTLNISFFGGLALGPFLGGLLESRFSLDAPFYFLAAAGLLIGGIIFLFLPESAARGRAAGGQEASRGATSAPWRELLASGTLRRLCAHRFLVSFGISTAWAFVPLYAVRALGLSTYDAGIAVGSITLFTAVLISPGGSLADRVDRWRVIVGGSLLLSVCLAAVPWSGGFWALVAVCGAMGLAQALYMPAAYALMVGEGRKLGMGASLGVYSTSLTLGLAAGPIVSGPVVDAFGLRVPFVIVGLLGLLASVAAVRRRAIVKAAPEISGSGG